MSLLEQKPFVGVDFFEREISQKHLSHWSSQRFLCDAPPAPASSMRTQFRRGIEILELRLFSPQKIRTLQVSLCKKARESTTHKLTNSLQTTSVNYIQNSLSALHGHGSSQWPLSSSSLCTCILRVCHFHYYGFHDKTLAYYYLLFHYFTFSI